jgi:signal transduction histidine kinase
MAIGPIFVPHRHLQLATFLQNNCNLPVQGMEEIKNQSALEAENARLRGDLLTVSSRIGHDLRTPLGGILTGAEALREILAEKNLPVAFTQAIVDSVDDLTRLIRQISFVLKASAHPLPNEWKAGW